MKRILVLSVACMSLTACATTSGSATGGGMAMSAFDYTPSDRVRRAGSSFGYELAGGADWQADLSFEDSGGGTHVNFTYISADGRETLGELTVSMPYLADGVRRYHGITDQGRDVSVELQAGPCAGDDEGEAWSYFASVQIDGRAVNGCAAERSNSDRWSNYLVDYLPAIDVCLSEFGSRARHVTIAYPLGGESTGVRVVAEDGMVWECATREDDSAINSLRPLDAADAYLGEGDPIFVRRAMPEASIGCYVYESVRDADQRLIGAFGHDTCDAGTNEPVG
jgi:hypothetical protein